MRVYRFLAPTHTNDGATYHPIALESFLADCLRLANSYTILGRVSGAWRDEASGQVYRESMNVVEVAVEDGLGEATRRRLVDLFREQFPDQSAVYSAEVGQAWIE